MKNNRKFLLWHVIGPPCPHQILPILKPLNQFSNIRSIRVTFPSYKGSASAMPFPVVENSLLFPFILVVNKNGGCFAMATSREPFIIVRVDGLDH